ncbi:MAG: hypothetical protein ACLFU2_00050 [Opitutales bacterium]
MARPPDSSRRGSALLLVIIFAGTLGVMLATTVPSLLAEYRLSHRRAQEITAYHLAEGGIELAVADLTTLGNVAELRAAGWAVDTSGQFFVRQFVPEDFGWSAPSGQTHTVRVLCDNPFADDTIRVWAKGTVDHPVLNLPPSAVLLEAELTVTLSSTTRAHPFIGLVSTGDYELNGQPYFDSYDSSIFPHDYARGVNSGNNAFVATTNDSAQFADATIRGQLHLGVDSDTPSDGLRNSNVTATGGLYSRFSFQLEPVNPPDTTDALDSF